MCLAVCAAVGLCSVTVGSADTWRGLTVAPEYRCSPYEADDYAYPPSVEADLIAQMGGLIYGPYTGTCFTHRGETDIEHLIARSEAHDSGLCAQKAATRAAFARDPLNLTLASPRVNRYQKRAADVAEWIPALNACWFAEQTIAVRQKYHLTIDAREVAAIEQLLAGCASTAMVITCDGAAKKPPQAGTMQDETDALARYDDNRNGRITCAEARRHGIAPVPRGHPAYRFMHDGDQDGMVCE